MSKKSFVHRAEAFGNGIFLFTMRLLGYRGACLLLRFVVFGYVFFSPKAHGQLKSYIAKRFPKAGFRQRWLACYRIIQAFGQVMVDRGWLGVTGGNDFSWQFHGYDELVAEVAKGRGVVLLLAHVGPWQGALAHLGGLNVKVHGLMKYDPEAASKHYFDLNGEKSPFDIIDVDGAFGGMIEATNALQKGEVVAIMGDRFVGGVAENISFLGESAKFPSMAYGLAVSTGASVATMFATALGYKKYEMRVWDIFNCPCEDRDLKRQIINQSCGRFVKTLEAYLEEYPDQWYNFYDFWDSKKQD